MHSGFVGCFSPARLKNPIPLVVLALPVQFLPGYLRSLSSCRAPFSRFAVVELDGHRYTIPLIGAQPSTAPMRPGQRLRVNNLPATHSLTLQPLPPFGWGNSTKPSSHAG